MWKPLWLYLYLSSSPLCKVHQDKATLYREGRVVWGALVQANSRLFRQSWGDAPAVAVYSLDPYFKERPQELREIGRTLFQLKGTAPPDEDLARFAAILTDERTVELKLPVPVRLTGGRSVFYTTILVMRKHLPAGWLASSVFPLVVSPALTEATMILPSRFWDDALVTRWNAGFV
jgi:hypothetical protein